MDCWKLFPNNIDTVEIKKSSFHSPSPSLSCPVLKLTGFSFSFGENGLHFFVRF